MANSKISALTSATTPLAGTETVPIVQSGATVKATVASFTGAGNYAGSFTTLTSSGTTTLGDATTDTVTVNGYMGVGGAPNSAIGLYIQSSALTGTAQRGIISQPTGSSAATSQIVALQSAVATAAAAFTCTDVQGVRINNATKGAGSTITNLHGVYIADQTQGTNNYGITSLVSSGSNKWNIYASGTAANYFAGNVGVGTTTTTYRFNVGETSVDCNIEFKTAKVDGLTQLLLTNDARTWIVRNNGGVSDAFEIRDLTAGATRLTIDASGNVLVTSSGGLGYGTGSGGTVTQATSRTTGVTLNKTNGAITLVSAAGLATFQSFTVTNSTVAATDVVHVTQKSGTDLYQIFVTATAAGSFRITFATTGGITVEQPVFNFAVIKGVTA
jgi:hypothetical protein